MEAYGKSQETEKKASETWMSTHRSPPQRPDRIRQSRPSASGLDSDDDDDDEDDEDDDDDHADSFSPQSMD